MDQPLPDPDPTPGPESAAGAPAVGSPPRVTQREEESAPPAAVRAK